MTKELKNLVKKKTKAWNTYLGAKLIIIIIIIIFKCYFSGELIALS